MNPKRVWGFGVVILAILCSCASMTYDEYGRIPDRPAPNPEPMSDPTPEPPNPYRVSIDEATYCRILGDGIAGGSFTDEDPYATLLYEIHVSVRNMGGNAYRIFHQRGYVRADFYVYLCPTE